MTAPSPDLFTPALSAVTLLVSDLDASQEFYARTFELEPLWRDEVSLGFALGTVVLNLLVESEGERLVSPAPVGGAKGASRGQLSIWVDDIDRVVEVLTERGVDFDQQPTDQPWNMRTATFRDPDGHSWEIGQDLAD